MGVSSSLNLARASALAPLGHEAMNDPFGLNVHIRAMWAIVVLCLLGLAFVTFGTEARPHPAHCIAGKECKP